MFKTILLPTDGSPLSEKATATAIEFAQLHKAKLVSIIAVQPFPYSPIGDAGMVFDTSEHERQMLDAAQVSIDKIAAAAAAAGVEFEGLISLSPTSPYEEIIAAAASRNCDIILMASHGRKGLNKLFLGSETQKVLAHTTLPVLVLR